MLLNDVDISSHEFEMMMAGTSAEDAEAEGSADCEEIPEASGGEDRKGSFDGTPEPSVWLSPWALVLVFAREGSVEAPARSPAMCGPRIFRTK